LKSKTNLSFETMSEMDDIYKWIEKQNLLTQKQYQVSAGLVEQIEILHDHISILQKQINDIYTKVPVIEIK